MKGQEEGGWDDPMAAVQNVNNQQPKRRNQHLKKKKRLRDKQELGA